MPMALALGRSLVSGMTGAAGDASPLIVLSASVAAEDAATGTEIGNLSVSNGSGSYTFSITADPDSKFQLDAGDDSILEVGGALDYETATSHLVTIEADNGVDDPITRQFTLTVTNVLEVTLNALTLDTDEIEEGSAEDTSVGTVQDTTAGASLSLIDDAGGRFKLVSGDIVAGATATNYALATSHNITVRETHPDGSNSPRDSIINITVTEAGFAAITLTQIDDGRVFQRTKETTSGPVIVAGTTTGQATAIEARVLLTADDSTVVDWTTIDASPGASSFSGTITTPQGGPYYLEVRDTVETGIGDDGTTDFYVGMWLVLYGQSNMANMSNIFITGTSAPSASAGTIYYDGADFVTPPAADGIRNLLNSVTSLTGLPVGAINGANPGSTSAGLVEGTDQFTALAALIAGCGGDAEFLLVHQGEGDADGVYTKDDFKTNWPLIHTSVADEVGRTTAQIPMLIASLATFGGDQGVISDAEWDDIQDGIIELVAENADIHYSHSHMDFTRTDEFHYIASGKGYAEEGQRYARSVAVLLGDETTYPAWFISAVEKVSATQTRVTLVHSMGDDFTPTSSISGFIVCDTVNGTYLSATGAREDATNILLTHATLPATSADDRFVEYQYGTAPDVSAPVVDNGALNAPLNLSAGQLLVDYALPVMTSSTTFSTPEEQTYVADLVASRPSTFAFGGTDGALFETQNGNELHFISAPDYEVPGDDDSGNDYDITVTPTAIDNSDEGAAQGVVVTVTDIADGAASYTFIDADIYEGSANSHAISADIGSEASDRYVLVGIGIQNGSSAPPVTVGGTSLSNLGFETSAPGIGFYGGLVTTGNGSQTVTVAYPSGLFQYRILAVWVLTGLNSTTPKEFEWAASSSPPTIAVEAGDFLFYIEYIAGAQDQDLSNATEAPAREAVIGPSAGGTRGYSADWTIAGTDAAFDLGVDAHGGSRVAVITFA
jgi:hypothetical protein